MFTPEKTPAALATEKAGHGIYAIDWQTADERIRYCKSIVTDTNQQMDPERLSILKAVYEENPGEEPVLIRAKLLERLLLTKKLFLDENPVVGTLTSIRCGLYAYPEWSCDWIKDEMNMAKICSLGEIVIPDETKGLMMSVYNQWKGHTVRDTADDNYKNLYGVDPRKYIKSGMLYDVMNVSLGSGCANYNMILTKGARGVLEEVHKSMENLKNESGDYHKLAFLQGIEIVLHAFVKWAHRYADLCEETAAGERDPKKKAELLETAGICRWVPENPARNFREAIQSYWFSHLLVEIEQMGCANSPGRFGQFMYPFYKRDIEKGRITREEANKLTCFLFIRHTELGTYSGMAHQKALSGHTGQTIALGGLTPDGKDASNDYEMVIMEVQAKMQNIQPTLALWYTPMMEPAYLMKAVDVVRTGCGQPQFMNTSVAVARNLLHFGKQGITIEDARNVANFGCVASGVAERGSYIAGEDAICLAKFVELALYNGWDPTTKQQLGPKTGDATTFTAFEDLYAAVLKQMDAGLRVQRRHSNLSTAAHEKIVPSIFRSALHDGCIESGLTEEAGGEMYPQGMAIVSTVVDAGNALHAINDLVFKKKSFSIAELLKALEANWVGFEGMQKMLLSVPKYGNDDAESDAYVQRLYKDFGRIYKACGPDYFGNEAHPDAYSLSFHNLYGSIMNAFPNGRKKGIAFTDGSVSATPGTDVEGATALIKSAAQALDTTWFISNHFNMKFLPSALEGSKGARALINLIKTYFDWGGSHIQFNCVSRETLVDAKVHPEKHKDLVVRVAGFSAYFTRLDAGVQDEIIKRTEYREPA